MARNRIEMSRKLFGRLIEHANNEGSPVANPEKSRFIKRLNAADAALLSSANVTALIVTRQIRFVRINYGNDLYFSTFGLPEPEEQLSGLEVITATPGIFALSIIEANVRPRRAISAAMIKNVFDDAYTDNGQGYEGHALDDVAPLFGWPVVYKQTDKLDYHEISERVLGSILARTYFDGPISLDVETVKKFIKLFEEDSNLIPFRNLVQGLLAISWENLFLELYRCVEQLYALPRMERLALLWQFIFGGFGE